jgi:hypothetical protein
MTNTLLTSWSGPFWHDALHLRHTGQILWLDLCGPLPETNTVMFWALITVKDKNISVLQRRHVDSFHETDSHPQPVGTSQIAFNRRLNCLPQAKAMAGFDDLTTNTTNDY